MDKARKPVVQVKSWGGQQRIPEDATFQISCSAFPALSVTHHTNTEAQNSAVELTAAQLFQDLGKQQKKAFAGAGEVDTEVTINTDDGKRTLNFKGIALGDTYSFSSTQVSIRGSAMPEWAMMDALNYSIYTKLSVDTNKKLTDAKSLLDVITITEARLIEGWSEVLLELSRDTSAGASAKKEQTEKIHQRNQKYRSVFLKIIKNSEKTIGWSSLDKFFKGDSKAAEALNQGIANAVMRILVGGKGSFLNTLNHLASQFQCIYIPGTEPGDPGKLVNMAYLVAAEPEPLELELLAGCSMQAGNPAGLLPVGYVFVHGEKNVDLNVKYPFLGISVPKEAMSLGGSVDVISAPDWLISNEVDIFKPDDIQPVIENEPTSASVKAAKSVEKTIKTATEDVGYCVSSVAAAWGLCHYAWVSLAHCKASLTVPCTFRYEIGKRYVVKCEGKELFTGFLSGYSSSISAGSCLTSLSFSHIMATGFSLPGTSEMKEAKLVQ